MEPGWGQVQKYVLRSKNRYPWFTKPCARIHNPFPRFIELCDRVGVSCPLDNAPWLFPISKLLANYKLVDTQDWHQVFSGSAPAQVLTLPHILPHFFGLLQETRL